MWQVRILMMLFHPQQASSLFWHQLSLNVMVFRGEITAVYELKGSYIYIPYPSNSTSFKKSHTIWGHSHWLKNNMSILQHWKNQSEIKVYSLVARLDDFHFTLYDSSTMNIHIGYNKETPNALSYESSKCVLPRADRWTSQLSFGLTRPLRKHAPFFFFF